MKNYLEQYVQEKQAELKPRDVSVTGSLDGINGIFCNVDAGQMQRVFDNLIENSCKYADPEGVLEIEVKAERQEDTLHILVSDNGKGLEEEKIQHVFEQFYRGDEARNAACDGNGLGLYVCRYIVEKHGGTMMASGKHGFMVELVARVKSHLASNPNIVFSKEQLFERIWGYDYMSDSATVTVHINRIRDKIEDDPKNPQIIETVWGAGYRLNLR